MRTLQGIVVSDAMNKTRVVAITRLRKHPRYHKYIASTTRVKAHDETNAYKKGDHVLMRETKPTSKEKRWIIVEKVMTGMTSPAATDSTPAL